MTLGQEYPTKHQNWPIPLLSRRRLISDGKLREDFGGNSFEGHTIAIKSNKNHICFIVRFSLVRLFVIFYAELHRSKQSFS